MRERQPEPFSLGRIFFGRFANLLRARRRSRREFGHPGRGRFRLEALEDRVLLSADLVGVPSLDTASELLRPGDVVEATVLVQNVGDASTRRAAQVDLYASLDGALDPSDILLDTELTESRISAGSSDSVGFRFSLPSTLKPGDYSLVSVVDADFEISESSETNNVGVGDGFSVAWTFGSEALTVRDADGTLVSFSLSGPGSGEIEVVGGEWDVQLTGTDGTSLFSVLTFGGNQRAALDDIHVSGALGGMHAPAVDLTGTLEVEGPLGTGLLLGSASGAAIVAPTIAGGEVFGFSVGGIAILGNVLDSEIVIGAEAGGRLGDLVIAGSMAGSSVRVGQDPVDGIFDNGNDRYYGGAESDIDSITILGTLSADSFFVAGAFPSKAFVNWRFIDTSTDPRFRLHELNRPPAALDQTVFGIEDTPLGGTLQAGDPDGDALSFSIVSAPARGALVLDASTGAFEYAPDEDANGLDSFTFQAFDGIELSNIATVTFDLAAVNDVPTAAADAYSTDEDVPLVVAAPGVFANDTDADGDALAAVLVEAPLAGHGTLELNADGWFTFTPEEDFHGTATFRYVASDGTEQSAPVAVSIAVNAVNDAPVAADDGYAVHAGQALTVDAPGLLANDFDVDGDALSLTRAAFNFPANGTLAVTEDGSFTYTPNAGFAGVDTFSYRATDGTELSNLATVTISVLNEAPVAVDDSYSMVAGEVLTIEAPGFLANDTDADGDALFAVRGEFPTNGTLHVVSDGSFTYAPNEGFAGIDTFTYRAMDGVASSDFATVTITVNPPPNEAPVIISTAPVVATEGLRYFYQVLAQDDDGDALSFELDLAPAGMAIDAAGAITWTPAEDQGPGVHDVAVRVSDGSESAVQAFAVTVAEVNLPPVLAPIGIHTVVEGGLLMFTASATDPDVPANTLSFSLDGAPAGASIDSATGVFTWTAPETDRATLYSLVVHVTDNGVEPLEDSETISVVLYEEGDSVVYWNVDASGSWADAGSWSGGFVPTAADIVVVDRPNVDVTVTVSGAAFSAERLIATDDVTVTGAGASLALGDGVTAAADGAVSVLAAGRLTLAPGSESSIEALLLGGTGSALVNQGVLALPSFDLSNVTGGTFHNAATGVLSVQSDSITVGNGLTLVEDGDVRGGVDADTIGSLTVNGGGTVTHSQGLESGLAFTVTGTLTVNGSINVTGRGYLGANNASFPGLAGQTLPGLTGASGAAGSYGGLGGSIGGAPNATYGSTTAPTHLGSGGGRTSTGAFVNGGNGGGRVDITAANVVIGGSIAADGASGANAGAGSGGSIRLALLPGGTVSGTGVIQANGGSNASANTGGGGGGRVAILDFAGMSLSSNNVRAFPGDAASDGQAGTVYLESAAQADGQGDLIINAGNIAGARPVELDNAMAGFNSVLVRNGRVVVPLGADVAVPLILQAGGLVSNQGTLTLAEFSPANITAGSFHNTTTGILKVLSDQATIGSGVTLTEDGELRGSAGAPDTLSTFTVNSGGVVTHSQGLEAGLSFDVTGTLTVNAGGVISVSGRGLLGAGQTGNISFTGQTIEGLAGSTGNAGGSHGGLGGAGSGGVPNATYGSEENPVHLGSGGARTQIGAFVLAGNGGGRIDLSAGNFVVNGAILANGGNGLNSTGGSGGSIRLEVLPTGAGDVSGTGEIRANGGAEGGSGGGDAGGGGGRVAILEYNALTLPVSRITAAGGAGLFPGQAGTVYLRSADDAPLAAGESASALYASTEELLAPAVAPDISLDELEAVLVAALDEWAAALGPGDDRLTVLEGAHIGLADLGGGLLGYADAGTILIDSNAAGYGWYIDPMLSGSQAWTYGSMDLFGAVMHELGHLMGFDHESDWVFLEDTLAAGKRYTIDWDADYAPTSPFAVQRSLADNFSEFLKVV
jgi:hypothetical protein